MRWIIVVRRKGEEKIWLGFEQTLVVGNLWVDLGGYQLLELSDYLFVNKIASIFLFLCVSDPIS